MNFCNDISSKLFASCRNMLCSCCKMTSISKPWVATADILLLESKHDPLTGNFLSMAMHCGEEHHVMVVVVVFSEKFVFWLCVYPIPHCLILILILILILCLCHHHSVEEVSIDKIQLRTHFLSHLSLMSWLLLSLWFLALFHLLLLEVLQLLLSSFTGGGVDLLFPLFLATLCYNYVEKDDSDVKIIAYAECTGYPSKNSIYTLQNNIYMLKTPTLQKTAYTPFKTAYAH